RYEAAKKVDLESVPVRVRDLSPNEEWRLAVTLNASRRHLSPLEKRDVIRRVAALIAQEARVRKGKPGRPATGTSKSALPRHRGRRSGAQEGRRNGNGPTESISRREWYRRISELTTFPVSTVRRA